MKREVKIGLFAILMVACAWAGIRFLKGADIFGGNNTYYAAYDQVSGLKTASAVVIKGLKVGSVTDIQFDPTKSDQIIVVMNIKSQYKLPVDSEANIFSDGLMGAKAIEIELGESNEYLANKSTIESAPVIDLMAAAGSELDFLKQRITMLTDDISKTLGNVNELMLTNAEAINGSITNMNSISASLDDILSSESDNLKQSIEGLAEFSQTLSDNSERIDSIMMNFNDVSADLANSDLIESFGALSSELSALVAQINEGDGTMGQLVSDPALYNSFNEVVQTLSSLLANVEAQPERYVHLSVFGRDPYKMMKKERKAREEFVKDSIKTAERELRRAQ